MNMSGFECPQCGAPLSPDATECRYCGEKINVAPNQFQQGTGATGYQQAPSGNQQNGYQQAPSGYQQNGYQQAPSGYQQNGYQQAPSGYQNGYQQTPPGYQQNGYQQPPYPPYNNPYGYRQLEPGIDPAWPLKNKVLAGILAIFFGTFGIHKFYLGKPVQGILYLVFMCTGFPTIISFIEGIIYVCSNDHNFQVKHHVRLH